MNFDKNLVGGSSDMLLLHLLRSRDMYGYEIIRELRLRSDDRFNFKEGTLYPILHKLEIRGYVKSYDYTCENGRHRNYYTITDEGRQKLDSELQKWREFTTCVEKVLAEPALA